MRRRRFLVVLGGAAVTGPIAAVAQRPAGVPRIGVLKGSSPSDEATKLDAFREALEKFGYIDGQTILIEVRYAKGQPDQFGSLARELVALAPSVIACVGRRVTAALLVSSPSSCFEAITNTPAPGTKRLRSPVALPKIGVVGSTVYSDSVPS